MSDLVEVLVGVIGRAHGVRGEVAVEPRTDEPERRFAAGAVLRAEDGSRRLTVQDHRWHSSRLMLRFRELADRSQAEAVRGTRLVVDVPADEQPSEAGEFYDRQLVGLQVLDAAGSAVGTVAAVVHLPGQELLNVATPDGPRLVPFVTALVPEVDLTAGTVQLADVPGLLRDEPSGDEPSGDEPSGDEPSSDEPNT